VRRVYRYRLYPTRRQREAIERQLGAACELYNAALEQRRWAWRNCGQSVGYGDQSAELRELRAAGLVDRQANFWSQQAVLRQLDRAFRAFFGRVRRGEKPGYPRFKSARRFSTLTWTLKGNAGGVAVTEQGRLRLQGIGCVKVKWHRELPADAVLGEVKLTRRAGGRHGFRYQVAFYVELPEPEQQPEHGGGAVGIDLGVRSFARLSTGEQVHGPRVGQRYAKKLARLQRAYARTKRGSRRRAKAAARIARARGREADRRRDHAHKASRALARRFSVLAVEDLKIKAMLRSAKGTVERPGTNVAAKCGLNRAIADQGWAQFVSMLAYKAEEAGGRVVRLDPRGSSQTCSECGERDRHNRRGAVFRCVGCGHRDDADTNAARVLLARAFAEHQGPGRGLQAQTDALASVA
jgi:putative transposase